MPKRKRQQKVDGGSPKSPTNVDEDRPATELQEGNGEAVTDEDLSSEEDPVGEVDEVVATQRRKKSLRNFLKQAKTQHYRVIEMRVVLVCSFGVFAKVIFSDALAKDKDSFVTHAALTFAACECHLMLDAQKATLVMLEESFLCNMWYLGSLR